ncbi:hypothetical protein EYZ11_011876 [Aspergillus tanneri]|uniref:D-xylose reductase [NAD(P)H] n=1 Tax=Aspergillus tanneri TaxID=1220188 RepID=A0A4S3J1N7_9EURO|nr:hypothetical protein EYZ11_011876 [Aspergillus tanneri]
MIGKVLSIRATLVGKYTSPQDGWRVMDNAGTFQDLGIHMLDVIIWLFGRPSSLLGHRVNDGPAHTRDRESHVAMRWDNSCLVGHLYISEVALCKEESLLVRGASGSLHLDGNEITHLDAQGRQTFHMVVQSRKEDPVQTMCQEFGNYISDVSESFSTSTQMADTLAASEAVGASFFSNKLEPVRPFPLVRVDRPAATQTNGHQVYHDADFNLAQQRFLLNTGNKIPGMGFGTRKPKKPRQTYEAVKTALEVGYRHIDTAFRYNNEDQVGEAVRDSAESVDLSLAALGLEYVDLLLMHWPSPVSPEDPKKAMPDWDFTQTWQDMQRVVESGRVRNIGVSNFGIRNLKTLLSHPKSSALLSSGGLVEFCKQHGIHCTAYSLLAFGLPQLHENAALAELCKRKSKTPQQILSALTLEPCTVIFSRSNNMLSIMWGLQRGTSVIPKSVTPERIAANFDLAGWALTPEEHHVLSNLDGRCRVYSDNWLPVQAFWEEDS